MAGGQVRRPGTQSRPKAPQRSSQRACKSSVWLRAGATGVFASDQHKPSVRYEGSEQANDGSSDPALGADQPTAPSDPEVMELEEGPTPDPPNDWRTLYLDYLLHNTLPTDKAKARWLARRAKSFILVEGELYKRCHTGILHLCIPGE